MIERLNDLKRDVERGPEERDLGFLQDHVVIWFVLG